MGIFVCLNGNVNAYPRQTDQKNPEDNLQKDEDESDCPAERSLGLERC
jgi:hypothetical protein